MSGSIEKTKLPDNFEENLKHYRSIIKGANSEPTIRHYCLNFINQSFGDFKKDEPKLEKFVRDESGPVVIRGRIDAILRSLLIEFKGKLNDIKIEEAESQIKIYICALQSTNYDCVISDGIRFIVYQPRVAENAPHFNQSMLELVRVDEINIMEAEDDDIYLWFDRYFLAQQLIKPDTERFSEEFGTRSSLFGESSIILLEMWEGTKEQFGALYGEWADYLRIVYGTKVDTENLFLRHTYLATLSKLMVHMFYSEGRSPSAETMKKIIDGTAFREFGIINFLDEDFFAWIEKSERGMDFCKLLRGRLLRYDITQINEDILKGLYQDLVDPKERHDLGEYYTPDWLADYIVQNLIGTKFRSKIMDPSCGSGTFLHSAINYKKEKLKYSMKPSEILENITSSIVGIDIHPLAVIIARSNYIMALGNLLKIGRKGKVVIPVYLSDSLKTPEPESELSTIHFNVFRKKVDEKTYLKIPSMKLMVRRKDIAINITDELIESVKNYCISLNGGNVEKEDFTSFVRGEIPELEDIRKKNPDMEKRIIEMFYDNARTMMRLIKDGKDTIWAFILKNFYKPVLFEHYFDFIVGNPPWLSYRYVKSTEYQEYLKKMISEQYSLTKKAELMTHMELAALFYLRASDLFLKDGGEIAFVMPRGIFSADQYDSMRKGECKSIVSISKIYDLDRVSPLFNVPSCVLIGKKGEKTQAEFNADIFSGKLSGKNMTLKEAKESLKIEKKKLYLGKIGRRSFISEEKISLEGEESWYFKHFSQGATIVPRQFWFVDTKSHSKLGGNPSTPFVKTSKRATDMAKPQYKDVFIEGNIEKEFLFGTLTGSEIVPFGNLGVQTVLLPLEIERGKFHLLDKEEAKKVGKNGLFQWLSKAETIWKQKRGEKVKSSATMWLDYRKKLTNQNPSARFKVLYNTSGMYLCCNVLDMELIKSLNGFAVESTEYVFDTDNEKESYYLCSLLNSKTIDDLLKPMQAKGLLGQRHIHKKPLEIPIPKFNASDKRHMRLAEIGKQCTIKISKELPSISAKYQSIGKIRSAIRKVLEGEIKEIDSLVENILDKRKDNNLRDFKQC